MVRSPGTGRASCQERADAILLVVTALLALCAFVTLFIVRALDDNRLTSWQWVFADGDVARMSGILVVGLALAFALTRVSLRGRSSVVALGLFSFVVPAALWREPEVIVDAARYFTQAKHLEVYGIGHFVSEWGRGIPAWTDLPLVPFLYGVLFSVFGETRTAIQALTTLCFAGTVLLTYGIGRSLWDETVGLYGGALLLGMPYLLTQVPLMLVDVPTMFFLALATWASIHAVRGGRAGWMALSSAAIGLALLAKYSTWPLLSVVLIVAATHRPADPRRILARTATIVAIGFALAGIVVVAKYDVIGEQLGLLWRYQVPGLGRWGESAVSTLLFQIHPFITAAAACSVAVAVKRRDWRHAVIAWPVLLVVASPGGRIRYALVAFPMLALMAAYGLREIGKPEVRRFAAFTAVISSLAVAVFGYLPHLSTTSAQNLRDAGRYLDSIGADAVEVFALPQVPAGINPAVSVPLLDLFTGARLVSRPGPPWSPPREEIQRSPLRFTWDSRSPAYYAPPSPAPPGYAAAVVILASPEQSLPEWVERGLRGYRLAKAFEIRDRWFQYQTVVRVYRSVEAVSAEERS